MYTARKCRLEVINFYQDVRATCFGVPERVTWHTGPLTECTLFQPGSNHVRTLYLAAQRTGIILNKKITYCFYENIKSPLIAPHYNILNLVILMPRLNYVRLVSSSTKPNRVYFVSSFLFYFENHSFLQLRR